MIRWAAWGILLVSGCTSVKLVQREGCWVRRSERLGQVVEELGPCTAPSVPWAEDRWSRAVQECVARADHRWQMQAQLAWSRGEPLPAPGPDDGAYRACLEEPAKALAGDNDLLRRKGEEDQRRLAELGRERDELRARVDDERKRREAGEGERLAAEQRMTERLLSNQEKVGDRLFHGQDTLAGYLGEAAKKSSQPAVANATATSRSDGSAKTEGAGTAPAVAASPAVRTPAAPARVVRRRVPANCPPASEAAAHLAAPPGEPAACTPAPATEAAARTTPGNEAPARTAPAKEGEERPEPAAAADARPRPAPVSEERARAPDVGGSTGTAAPPAAP